MSNLNTPLKELDMRVGCYLDLNGKPVQHTPQQYTYSYDPYVVFKQNKDPAKKTYCYWSDHIDRREGVADLKMKHFKHRGDHYGDYTIQQIQDFLRELDNDPNIEIYAVMHACNVSNGFPVWSFHAQY